MRHNSGSGDNEGELLILVYNTFPILQETKMSKSCEKESEKNKLKQDIPIVFYDS